MARDKYNIPESVGNTFWHSAIFEPSKFVLRLPDDMSKECKEDLIRQLKDCKGKPALSSWAHSVGYGPSPLEEILKKYNQEERMRLMLGDPYPVKINVSQNSREIREEFKRYSLLDLKYVPLEFDKPLYMGIDLAHGESESVRTIFAYDGNGKWSSKQEPIKKDMKHIGYKFKPGYEKYLDAAAKIIIVEPEILKVGSEGANFLVGSPCERRLYDAGVLNIWFDSVYEKTEQDVKLKCAGTEGYFTLKVSKMGIYYATEDKWLPIEPLRLLVTEAKKHEQASIFAAVLVGTYKFKINVTIEAGCKKQTSVDEWLQVLEIYDSFQQEDKKEKLCR
jgi:hypothetical protein